MIFSNIKNQLNFAIKIIYSWGSYDFFHIQDDTNNPDIYYKKIINVSLDELGTTRDTTPS